MPPRGVRWSSSRESIAGDGGGEGGGGDGGGGEGGGDGGGEGGGGEGGGEGDRVHVFESQAQSSAQSVQHPEPPTTGPQLGASGAHIPDV